MQDALRIGRRRYYRALAGYRRDADAAAAAREIAEALRAILSALLAHHDRPADASSLAEEAAALNERELLYRFALERQLDFLDALGAADADASSEDRARLERVLAWIPGWLSDIGDRFGGARRSRAWRIGAVAALSAGALAFVYFSRDAHDAGSSDRSYDRAGNVYEVHMDDPDLGLSGFFDLERDGDVGWRWSNGAGGVEVRDAPVRGDACVLSLSVLNPATSADVRVNGRRLEPMPFCYRMERADFDERILSIQIDSPVFIPAEAEDSDDQRELGLAVAGLRIACD
ncbi:MAG: hypothetical protein AB7S26_00090 [Sandaracinaceae bacterium]